MSHLEDETGEATGIHYPHQRSGGGLAARGKCAAGQKPNQAFGAVRGVKLTRI
jgi:hypothetical protein